MNRTRVSTNGGTTNDGSVAHSDGSMCANDANGTNGSMWKTQPTNMLNDNPNGPDWLSKFDRPMKNDRSNPPQ